MSVVSTVFEKSGRMEEGLSLVTVIRAAVYVPKSK